MPDWLKWVELGGRVASWAIGLVGAFIGGASTEDAKRLVEILPPELKADVEHARQYEIARKVLVEELGDDDAG